MRVSSERQSCPRGQMSSSQKRRERFRRSIRAEAEHATADVVSGRIWGCDAAVFRPGALFHGADCGEVQCLLLELRTLLSQSIARLDSMELAWWTAWDVSAHLPGEACQVRHDAGTSGSAHLPDEACQVRHDVGTSSGSAHLPDEACRVRRDAVTLGASAQLIFRMRLVKYDMTQAPRVEVLIFQMRLVKYGTTWAPR
eukprot:TRINITY_DN12631_c0_g1_i10.p1 TRINITY_DN12631_c0_g1~~TRINITY_DN12631_c0_g1_i10.p1  ORF type:complete len:198 (-),score=28.38 TRINITY_DN12631_c0_g1_i10:798-1391(-)